MDNADPFMPAFARFPRDAWPPALSDEPPSAMRPFLLRSARPVDRVATAKHRTQPHQTLHTDTTTSDGQDGETSVPDTWYEPDD